MSDPRDDYQDPAPERPWRALGDPTGLPPCDRAQLAGWVGILVAVLLLGIGIAYGGVLVGVNASDLLTLGMLGGITAAYGFSGAYLIAASVRPDPPRGPLVLVCNLIIVGPLVAVPVVLFFGPLVLVVLTISAPGGRSAGGTLLAIFMAVGWLAVHGVVVWQNRRKVFGALLAWLDPTNGEWW